MWTVGTPQVGGQAIPILDLAGGVPVGLGVARAGRPRVAIEVLELRGHFADDARLAFGGQTGQAKSFAHVDGPVTHRSSP